MLQISLNKNYDITKILKENQDKEETLEENVVSEQEILTISDPETETNVPITVYTGHGTPVTSETSTPVSPTNPLNMAAGSSDPNMVNIFQGIDYFM